MPEMTVNQAIADALAEEMRRDPRVVMFGEGVATKRRELVAEFGEKRVRNTPLAEAIIAGTAAGAAATGLRPVIDLLFVPFMCYSMDQIVNSAAKLRYISGGQFSFPMVVIGMTGCGWTVGAQHNHNLESWFVHSAGLKVVMPSTPDDFKGLLKASIRDDNPVLFFIDMVLGYQSGEVPASEHVVPIGEARVRQQGTDVTIVSYAKTVHTSLQAAGELAAKGIAAEVIDLRSLKPLDEAAILKSVRKTGRLIVVHEASRSCGVGAEVSAIVAEHAFTSLKAPIVRVTGPDAPPPSSYALEQAFMPQAAGIVAAAESAMLAVV
jgi:pyruvate dehydrogenase E1 component beta subunit